MTGFSIGCVTRYALNPPFCFMSLITMYPSVKMVGLFVTALVGLYTIEDLWDKFGDLKMSAVRRFIYYLTFSFSSSFTEGSSETLGCPGTLPNDRSNPRLHGVLQNPLLGLEPFRPR